MTWLRRNRWWLTRVVALPFHVLVFAVITFILLHSIPGDPIRNVLGQNYSHADYLRMKAALGLNGSVTAQLVRYLRHLASFNLGTSLNTGQPVLDDFRARFPATVELAVMGLLATVAFSTVASYLAVMHPSRIVSRVIRLYARTAGAVPDFVLAVFAIFLFYSVLHWAPAPIGRWSTDLTDPRVVTGFPLLDTILTGYWAATASELQHLILPVLVLALAQSPVLIKLLIAGLTDALEASPTLFRIASGASRRAVLLSAYRRAAPAAVTMCGIVFGYQLGGAVVLETLFGFSGMGQYVVAAVSADDYVAMQGFLIVMATLMLVVYLLVDLVNMVLDPRRRPGTTEDAR